MEISETELMLKGYGLTTAEFYYRMPDYTSVLNSFIWQARSRDRCIRCRSPIAR